MYCAPARPRLLFAASASAPAVLPPSSPAGLPVPSSWIDMSQEGAIADGLPVMMLSDRSSVGRTFTSASPGVYKVGIRNGLPVLRTTAALTAYLASAAPVIANNTPFCLWFVGQSNGSDAIVWGNSSPNNQVRINYTASRLMYLFTGPDVQGALTAPESTAWNIFMFVRDAANNGRLYLNGALKGGPTNIGGSVNLGRFLESFSVRFVGDFGEAGYNSADFSKAQLNSLGQYLGAKWAIAWSDIP
jgi:hypothetical protein